MRMQESDRTAEASRWLKFPATILLAAGVLWLLQVLFEPNLADELRRTRTGIGSILVFVDLLVIPLGSVVVGIGLLYLQRWALHLAFVMPALPLAYLISEKAPVISGKFAQFHQSGDVAAFGDGVMKAVLLIAMVAIYVLIVMYLIKALRILGEFRQRAMPAGMGGATADRAGQGEVGSAGDAARDSEPTGKSTDDLCLIMPEVEEEGGEA
ncbi:hypothetical protein IIA79_03250 [bacterium]|nr:hypothetical protein [bacterium]